MRVLLPFLRKSLCVLLLLPLVLFSQDNALLFDDSNDHITFATSEPFGSTMTFEAWINPSTTTGTQTIADWTDGSQIARLSLSNGFLQLLEDDGFGMSGFLTGSIEVQANEWTHIAMVRTGGSTDFYVNGVIESEGFNVASGGGDTFTLGIVAGTFNAFGGLMDEVRIWDTALPTLTIQNQMFTSLTGTEPNLVTYYQFNETTGTILPDLSPNGHDGTLVNFPVPTDPSWQASAALTEVFSVLNINDDFSGSLRQTIVNANASLADNVVIDINIGVGGPRTISLVTELPAITRSMTIDGESLVTYDFATEEMITLDLSGVTNGDGFNIQSADVEIAGIKILDAEFGILVNGEAFDNVVIRDNIISSNNNTAINIINGDNVRIVGNHIGVDGDGLTGSDGSTGIVITGCTGAVIGGDRMTGDGNMIAGSVFSSYLINIASSSNITIEGNIIGASTNGNDITVSRGVLINNSDNVTVGNANNDRRNYIAGIDASFGLSVSNGDQVNIINNYFGVGIVDTHLIGNNSGNSIPGITSTTGLTNFTIDGNVVSGANEGITLGGTSSTGSIINNLIGVAPDGTTAFGNTTHGINLTGSVLSDITIGGSGNENTIANNSTGIRTDQTSFGTIDISANSIYCNASIGIDIAGTPLVTAPEITSVSTSVIRGTTSVEDNANILVFQSNDGCGDSQGRTFLVEGVDVVSGGEWTVTGSFSLNNTYTAIVVDDETTVDAMFGASEFSSPVVVEEFSVTNINDAGAGSLRQAILDANASTSDIIQISFGILVGGGPWTIAPTSALPAINNANGGAITIDALTQPTSSFGSPTGMVILDGTSAGTTSGLTIDGANTQIYGLVIENFSQFGIRANATADGLFIGGAGRGNVIKGNNSTGIQTASGLDNVTIQGNYIGIEIDGSTADANLTHGISISGSNFTVGGDSGLGEGNVISGNGNGGTDYGIVVSSASSIEIFGNMIGTNPAGSADLGNNRGINIASGSNINIGGSGTGQGNVISGNNGSFAIVIQGGSDVVVDSNIIGLDVTGTTAIPNVGDGIRLTTSGLGMIFQSNTISGNTGDGIDVDGVTGSDVIIQGNYIGTDASGTAGGGGLGNLGHGVTFRSSSGLDNTSNQLRVLNNVISGNGNANTDRGINTTLINSNILIRGNMIGVEADGTTALGNAGSGIQLVDGVSNITIGGTLISEENIIANSQGASATSGYGIYFDDNTGNDNVYALANVQRNRIFCNTNLGIGHENDPQIESPIINSITTGAISGTTTATGAALVFVFNAGDACNSDQGATYLGTAVASSGTWSLPGSFTVTDNFSAFVNSTTEGTSPFGNGIQVSSIADAGLGTFRDVITRANVKEGTPYISFGLSSDGSGTTWTTAVSTPLPTITNPMIIDGATQSGWDMNNNRLVVLDGGLATGSGLNCNASDVEIYGLKITDFSDDGISLSGGSGVLIGDATRGNVINGNGDRGIEITLTNNVTIRGNRIGTNYNGTAAIANNQGISLLTSVSNTIIGGAGANQGNLISGNTNNGIGGNASGPHQIINNIIGLNISHNAAIPNGGDGIGMTTSGNNTISNNIISANGGAGISLSGSNQTIIANTIGTDLTGTTPFGNAVGIQAANTGNFDSWQIGTGNDGEGNVIAFNTGAAVLFTNVAQTGHLISENSMYSNGLGIDLSGAANTNLAVPSITSATESDVTVGGVASGDLVEVFVSDGQGQGQTFLGSAVSSGTSVTVGSLTQSVLSAQRLVATRIDGSNNTSQFSTEFFNYPTLVGAGNAIVLDGADDHVNLDDPDLSGMSAITVEAWINPSDVPSGPTNETATIIAKGTLQGPGTSSFGLYLRGNDGFPFSEIVAQVDNGTEVAQARANAFAVQAGEWAHVAMVWSAGNPVELYINGINAASSSVLAGTINVVGDPLQIGTSPDPEEINFEGQMDEMRIWSAALTQSTIRDFLVEEFIAGTDHPNDGDIMAYYRFDESGGTSLGDLNGNIPGTIEGGATFTTSGAYIGDESAHTTTTSVALGGGATSGNNLTINNIQGSPDITYLYRVNEAPNNSTVDPGLNTLNTTDYYGVFQSGGTNPTFNAQWFYTNNTAVSGSPGENGIRFMKRANNADGAFDEFSSNVLDVDSTLNIVIDQNITSGEFAQGYTDPYLAPTPPGNALDFDGTNDVVDLGTDLESVFAGPSRSFTIEAWINPETFTGANRKVILAKNGNSNCAVDERQFAFVASLDEGLRFVYYGANDLSQWRAFEGGTIYQNTWQHIAVTYDGSINTGDGSDRVRFYINGILQTTNAGGGAGAFPFDIASGPSHVGLGGSLNSSGALCENPDNVFDGGMDEVRIWNTALSGATITAQAFSAVDDTHPNYGNLVSHYRMDDSNGSSSTTTLSDLAGTNNGTLLNFPADNSSNWITSGAYLPSTPSDLFTTEVSSIQIDLSWSDNSGSETGFTIQRSDGNSSSWGNLGTVGPDVSTYSDMSVTANNGYFYRVVANSPQGNSLPSNEKFASTLTPPGNALSFDGVDDYVDGGDDPGLYGHSNLTLEAWVRPDFSLSNTEYDVISTIGTAGGSGYQLTITNSGTLNVFFRDASFNDEILFGSTVLPEGEWSHIAGVIENAGASSNLYLYVNGVLDNNNTVSDVPAYTSTANLTLGSNGDGAAGSDAGVREYHGSMDEVRIWSNARTQPQIQSNMFSSLVGNESGLVAYYRFDQDEGTDLLIPDRSANNNNGSWSGSGSGTTTPQWPASTAFDPFDPTALRATEVSATQIDLSWTDNSTNETGFTIQRSDGNNTSFSTLSSVGAGVTTFSDMTVTADNGYFYRVIANAPFGDSNPSNEKFGSTITPPGNALEFDGADDYVEVSDNVIPISGDFTVELWARKDPAAPNGLRYDMISQVWEGGFGDNFWIGLDLDDELRISTDWQSTGVFYPDDGLWHHIAVVRSATDLELYIDGVFQASLGSTISYAQTATPEFRIGRHWQGSGDFWNGEIDEVRIWSEARTSLEIQSNMFSTLIGSELNLEAYFRFDQDEATDLLIPDRSNNNNNGTWNGSGAGTTVPQWPASAAFTPFSPSALLTAEVSTTQIDLSWTDNSSNETGFTIERSDGNNTSFSTLASVGTDITTFSDNTVTADNGYYYRVIANSATGDSSPSNEKFGSTISAPGNAIRFDGVDDYVSFNNVAPLMAGSETSMTVEFWFNANDVHTTTNSGSLFSINSSAGQNTFLLYLGWSFTGADNRLGITDNNGSAGEIFGPVLADNCWHHVAYTRSGSTGTLYIDGFLYDTHGAEFTLSADDNWSIGQEFDPPMTASNFLDGRMDEIRVWNIVRTESQIQSTIDQTLNGNEAGLVAYYRLDQDEATDLNVPDRSNNNSDATWNGVGAGVITPQWEASGALSPLVPTMNFVNEVSDTQIDLTWMDNSFNETDFTIERSEGNNSSWTPLITVPADQTSFSDNTVTAENRYFYRVLADGITQDSKPSNAKFGGTLVDPSNATQLDGTDDYFDLNSIAAEMVGRESAMTVEFWVNAPDIYTGGRWGSIFGIHNSAGDNEFVIHIASAAVSMDNQIGVVESAVGTELAGPVIGDNTWYHVAYVRDGTTGTLYIDGAVVGTHTADFVLTNSHLWSIGADWDPGLITNDFFEGQLDEFRIWSTVRSQTEIQNNRFNTLVGNESGLVAYYRFDQDDATVLLSPDRTANRFDAIWNGSASGITTPRWPISDAFAPIAPSMLITTEVSDTRIDLSWQDNSTLETDFVIERSNGNISDFVQIGTSEADAPSYVDNSVTPGNGYFYRVKAINGASSSEYTNTKFGGTISPPGFALQFDGTDDEVTFDAPLQLTYSDFTLEFWARVPVTNTGQVDYFVQEDPAGGGTPQIVLASTFGNSSYMFLRETNGGATALVQGTRLLNDNTWHHIAFVRDGTNLHAYIDGQLEGSTTVFSGDIVFPSNATSRLDGDATLDEFKLWDVALTQSEIQSGLGTVSVGNESNLVSYYRFDQDEATDFHLPDRSNANNNGTWTDGGGGVTSPQWVSSDALRIGGVTARDYTALLALYNDTNGANWTVNTNWLSSNLVSTWHGVTVVGDRVTEIQLVSNYLSGTIPTELQDLSALTILDLGSNALTGTIPTELGTLSNLTDLILFDNQLTGSIPVEIGDLSNLRDLELDVNQLTGSIPTELGNLSNLRDLELDGNMLSGSIPTTLGNLSSLDLMTLDDNQLTGSIPIELGNLANLEDLRLHENQLTGSIPAELGNLTLLDNLELDRNMLSGSIPIEIGNLVNLLYLSLFTNDLTGTIPSEIGSLTSLQHLDLSHNMLSGSVPTEIGMLAALTHLELDDNQLTGAIPTEIGSLTLLDDLQLDINQFTGTVPSTFTSLTNLTNLELSENMLTDLPDLSSITGLTTLLLQSNSFEFDDLEPNAAITGVTYSPQANLSAPADQSLNEGDNLSVSVTVGGSANQYQWYKDGAMVSGQTTSTLSIGSVVLADAGDYHLEVTNTVATGLTISTDPFTLSVDGIPTVVTQDISVSLDATGNVTITPAQIDNGSSDDITPAGSLIFSLDVTDFDCSNTGSNTVTLTVTDGSGNSANATATVTVLDDSNPNALTQDIAVVLDASGQATITPADIDNGSSDNCSLSLSLDNDTFDCSNLGDNTVTLTATDPSGNSANATATVTVSDNMDPSAVAQDISVTLDATGQATIVASDIDNGSADNCSVSLSLDVTSFDCSNLGSNTVTLTATDPAGNSSNATATVTVSDDITPTAIAQDITVMLDATGQATIVDSDVDNGSSDNCSVSLAIDVSTFDCADLGSNAVTLTATDPSGNSANAIANVTVIDNVMPTIVTQDISVMLDASGQATISPTDIDGGSSDNCGVSLSLNIDTFDCSDLGGNTVTLTAVDPQGNSINAPATVTVTDNIAPIAVAQDISVVLDASGQVTIAPSDVDNGSSDNCSVSLSLNTTTFDCTLIGANPVTLTATDPAGNSSSATAMVTVSDNIVPTVITQDISVAVDASGMVSILPSDVDNGSSDNCGLTLSLDNEVFDCSSLGANTVTLTATDASGNTANATAIVTVVDNIAPTVVTQNITVVLDASNMATITPAEIDNGTSDNCSFSLSLDITSFDDTDIGTNTVTLTATDPDGNSSSETATVTVESGNLPPDFVYTFYLDENSENGTLVGAIVVTDPENDPITYSIASGNTDNAFAIGSTDGLISVSNTIALDFETTPSFSLMVEADDGQGTMTLVSIIINLNDLNEEMVTGIPDLDEELSVYPNPAEGSLFVKTQVPLRELEIDFYSISGKEIKIPRLQTSDGVIEFDLREIPSGIYLMKVKEGERVATKNILVR